MEALAKLQQHHIDLLFLDIQMPQILGTDFQVRTLKLLPKIIFHHGFCEKFAIEGFELDAVDYLLKPISFERFLKGVNKIMEPQSKSTEADARVEKKKREWRYVYTFSGPDRKVLKVALNDILYIESLKDYIKVCDHSKQNDYYQTVYFIA